MKSILYSLLLLLSGPILAQNVQLMISPDPSPFISDWQSRTETVVMVISNTTGNDIRVKIKAELFDGSGGVLASTKMAQIPELTVPAGVTRYSAEDVFPLSAISYSGGKATGVAQTGRIPDDNYRLCVSMLDPKTGSEIVQPTCKTFAVIAFQAPTLLAPRDKETVPPANIRGVLFRWTPVIPAPKSLVTYKLQVWEVLPGQTPMNALRSNQPIVDKDLKGQLQSQWPTDFALPELGKTYVWTITPMDNEGRKLVDGYGFAEPLSFKHSTDDAFVLLDADALKLISPTQGSAVNMEEPMLFRWTPVVPKPGNPIAYKLRVWQLMQGQNGTAAMKSNKPILEKTLRINEWEAESMETGPCKPPYLCDFVWEVALMDQSGNMLTSTSGNFKSDKVEGGQESLKLLSPLNDEEINLDGTVTFRWTPLVPKPQQNITYKLRVWQLMQGQNGTAAMKSNKPILEQDVSGSEFIAQSILTGPCKPPYLCDFVWNVEVNNAGSIVSLPGKFKISMDKMEAGMEAIRLMSPKENSTADPTKGITFKWFPVKPESEGPIRYSLRVWQLMQGQNGTSAMKSNLPILMKEVDGLEYTASSLETGPCKPPYLCDFVWAVTADQNGKKASGTGMFKVNPDKMEAGAEGLRLLSPKEGAVIDPRSPVTFKITSGQPEIINNEKGRIKVWQLMQGQNGTAAMKSNTPVVEKDFEGTEITVNGILTGPCKPPYLCDFIWEVSLTDKNGKTTSQTSKFSFDKMEANSDDIRVVSPADGVILDPSTPVTFKLTSGQPEIINNEKGRLKVWQLMQGQNGTAAMKSNKPVIDKEFSGMEVTVNGILTGPCKPPYLCDFIWEASYATNTGKTAKSKPTKFSFEAGAEAGARIQLLSPGRKETVDLKGSLSFRWTPLVPKPQEPVTYKIKVWQLMQGTNASSAMKTSPMVEKEVRTEEFTLNATEIGPCKPPYLCDFVWMVEAMIDGKVVSTGRGEFKVNR